MNQRFFLTALGVGALVASAPLIGCGDFSGNEEPAATGGAGTGGVAGTGGDAAGSGGMSELPPLEVSCENVVACGGDVVGNWFAVDSCLSISGALNLTSFGIGCTEGTVEGTLEVNGNLKFDAANDGGMLIATDNTQTYTGTTAPLQIGLSAECLDVSGTVTQCDGVQGPLKSLGFIDPTLCVPSTSGEGGCDCTATVTQDTVPGFVTAGTSDVALYTVDGTVLNLEGNVAVDYDYCVQGDFMLATPKAVGNVGSVTTGTILFQRQDG